MQGATMQSATTTVRLDPETRAQLDKMAEQIDRPRAWIIKEAVAQYLEREAWHLKFFLKSTKHKSGFHGTLPDKAKGQNPYFQWILAFLSFCETSFGGGGGN